MTFSRMIGAIRQAIRLNELGKASPYQLSYARLGNSGASFGIFQHDTHVNPAALSTLTSILQEAGCDAEAVRRITTLLARACPGGSPLAAADAATVNAALDSASGRARIDALDERQLQTVMRRLDQCLEAASRRSCTITGEAQLYLCLWINMTGAPETLCSWLQGRTVAGVAPPAGPVVTAEDVTAYLKASKYFTANPKNFAHMQASVRGAMSLPAA